MGRATNVQPRTPLPPRSTEIERYRDNWVRHLLGVARDLDRRVLARLADERGYEQIRPSLGPFLSLVWQAPRPLTQLAQALGVSRQACSKLARLAEQPGYVERVDGNREDRAQRIRLTPRGRSLVDDGVQMISEAEVFYAERIGEDRLRRFITAAASLFYGLGLQQQTDPALEEATRRSIGVLPLITHRVEEDLRETTRAKGHDVLQLSHARLIALIGHEGARVSEMARRQGVSRQATSATVRSLESLGYARRETDEDDGRAVHVVLTRRGQELIRDSLQALEELELGFREILGARRFADLVNIASELYATLLAEEEAIEAALPRVDAGAFDALDDRSPSDSELRGIAARLEQRLGRDTAARLGILLSDRTKE